MSHKAWFALFLSLGILALQSPAQHRDPGKDYWSHNYGQPHHGPSDRSFTWQVVGKAQPDECYFGVGAPENLPSFYSTYGTGSDLATGYGRPCSYDGNADGVPKVNQAYVWGMTTWGNRYVWFGTIANTLCLVMEALEGTGGSSPAALQDNTVVCEAGKSGNTDARPARIFLYDTFSKKLEDMTPLVKNFTGDGGVSWTRLQQTFGLRSAGSMGDVVILGGLYGNLTTPGVAMYAFDARHQKFLGSIVFDGVSPIPYPGVPTASNGASVAQFSNIRQWLAVENQLYVGVATGPSAGFGAASGAILRWTGNVFHPFRFVVVGTVGADPAYLAFLNDRIFVNTWGTAALNGQYFPAGSLGEALYMSPKFNYMLPPSTASWGPPVFTYAEYEPEPSAAMDGGAIAAFDGALYITTMTPPGTQALQFANLYPGAPKDTASQVEDFLGSYRPTAMFRGTGFDNPRGPQFQLLYGNTELPQFVTPGGTPCPTGSANTATQATCSWTMTDNKMGQAPLYGLAGYNNVFNSYTWWMNVYDHQLFVGTFDWSYLAFETLYDQFGSKIPPDVIAATRQFEGADLLRIPDGKTAAIPVSLDGMGNFSNYGVRNMVDIGGDMYVGTANPFNLLTNPSNTFYYGKLGGWELIDLTGWNGHHTPPQSPNGYLK